MLKGAIIRSKEMRKYAIGLFGSLLTAIIGGWLVIAPTALTYQPAGANWSDSTKNDLWVGIGVVFVSLVGAVAYGLGLVGQLRAEGVLPERKMKAEVAPQQSQVATQAQSPSLEEVLAPLVQALIEDRQAARTRERGAQYDREDQGTQTYTPHGERGEQWR